jgi:CDP-diacylglycerol---glycerol-3-phosphate 3-phosphatidyltransferase
MSHTESVGVRDTACRTWRVSLSVAGWQAAGWALQSPPSDDENLQLANSVRPQRREGMNLPNKLTVSRFALTVVFLWAVFSRSPVNDTLALVFFCVASLTDFFDGRIARKRGIITNFGTLMDPLADKILICSAFIALVERGHIDPTAPLTARTSPVTVEAWMVVVIVARELAITGLRLLAAAKQVVLGAEGYGKHKTISQVVAVIALLVMDAHVEWWPWLQSVFAGWIVLFARIALWVALVLTALSGCIYLWRNRRIYMDDL